MGGRWGCWEVPTGLCDDGGRWGGRLHLHKNDPSFNTSEKTGRELKIKLQKQLIPKIGKAPLFGNENIYTNQKKIPTY